VSDTGQEEQELDLIVEARANEIIANVLEQLKLSGLGAQLNEGIVLTGGGALLRNTVQAFKQRVQKPVRLADIDNQTQACARGILLLGKENCAAKPAATIFDNDPETAPDIPPSELDNTNAKPDKEAKRSPRKNILGLIKNGAGRFVDDLFGDDEMNNTNK
jgi:cell division protein FtsA